MASGNTLSIWSATDNRPPASSAATPDTRNSTSPHWGLAFATGEIAIFEGLLPRNYAGGGVTVAIWWTATSTTNFVEWSVAFERHAAATTDLDSDDFASDVASSDAAAPASAGVIQQTTIAVTNGAQMDSLAVGESYRLRVTRTTPTGSDMSGDALLLRVEVRET